MNNSENYYNKTLKIKHNKKTKYQKNKIIKFKIKLNKNQILNYKIKLFKKLKNMKKL